MKMKFFIKKAIFFLILVIALIFINLDYISLAQDIKAQNAEVRTTETITIATYYPAPYGVYKTLRLYPTSDFNPMADCSNKGEAVYNNSDNHVYICEGSKWMSSAVPLVIYAQDQIVSKIKDIVIEPDPNPTFDKVMILRVPVKAQDVVKVSFAGMFQGPGYTGVWLTSGPGILISGWMPSARIGAWGNDWVSFQVTGFWKATADGVLIFQQGFYKSDLLKETSKDSVVAVNGRFAFAEKVYLVPSQNN